MGPYRDSEQALARDLLETGCFGPGMLVLADRKFLSWALAREFLATGAHILWRASAAFTLRPVKVLADGTYLAELKPPRKGDGPPLTVRVIEYTVHTAPETAGMRRPPSCSASSPACWNRRVPGAIPPARASTAAIAFPSWPGRTLSLFRIAQFIRPVLRLA